MSMGQFGDTSLTKVFVGGLAWETQKETLKDHFDRHGEILEAVIISDKATGRSKGYGFVTFKEPEAARKACEDPSPVINGRRANCNLASVGARRGRGSPTATPAPPHHQPHGMAMPMTKAAAAPAPSASPGHWLYPPTHGGTYPSSLFHHQQHYHGGIPFYASYGYSPYVADVNYNAKLSHHTGGGMHYMHGHFPHSPYPTTQGGMLHPNAMLPFYPIYHYNHHPHTMGVPTHFFPHAAATRIAAVPAIISKPIAARPAMEQVTG